MLKIRVVLAVSRMAGTFALIMSYSNVCVTKQYDICYLLTHKK